MAILCSTIALVGCGGGSHIKVPPLNGGGSGGDNGGNNGGGDNGGNNGGGDNGGNNGGGDN
ncbi:hypothetical protein, partial [Methylobacillus rhizosphaerae]